MVHAVPLKAPSLICSSEGALNIWRKYLSWISATMTIPKATCFDGKLIPRFFSLSLARGTSERILLTESFFTFRCGQTAG